MQGQNLFKNRPPAHLPSSLNLRGRWMEDGFPDSLRLLRMAHNAFWTHQCTCCFPTLHEWRLRRPADVCILVYLDDILIYSDSEEEHRRHVREILQRLQQHHLYAHADKCFFHVSTVEYLGYILSLSGLTMASDKVQIIQDWPEPRNIKDIQSFLGFTNFYQCFILKYSEITVPLRRLFVNY